MELDSHLAAKVEAYRPDVERALGVKDVPLLILAGVSGAGKDALKHKILDDYPQEYRKLITHTTRLPRINNGVQEREGVEYHFINLAQAEAMLANHDFLEANVYVGNVYGLSVAELEATRQDGRVALGDIDINGIAHAVELGLDVRPVFVVPPSFEAWQARQQQRYGRQADPNDLRRRMITAQNEITHALAQDHFYFVLNDNLGKAAKVVHDISRRPLTVERRPAAAIAALDDILRGIRAALA